MTRSKRTSRLIAAILAILLTALLCTSCASSGKSLLTMDHEGTRVSFSVNFYELMLSRMKGIIMDEVYNATENNSFWDILDKHNGTDMQTLAQYYGDLILENCKTFTTALWLFEYNNLSLTDEQVKTVNDRMKTLLEDYADGSKTRFNAILAEFGVNYNMLREVYLMEEKVTAVQEHLYGANASKLGVAVKDEFLKNNYVRFKQIHLPSFNYVYETDKNGDVIYYVEGTQTNAIAYDQVNGFEGKNKNNIPITDANGDTVYYATADYASQEKPRIAYDSKNGVPAYVLDDKGVAKTVDKTKEELDALAAHASNLLAELEGCTAEEFEAKMKVENRPVLGKTEYEEGYYIQKNVDFSAVSSETAYLSDIVTALDAMEVGGIAKIDSGNGYHIVMKYEPLSRAYDTEANSIWFKNFKSALVESLFLEECRSYFSYIQLDEKILAISRDIKAIGTNPVF